jgi:hypothetical protein
VLPGPRVSTAPRRARPAPHRCSPGPVVTRSRLSATRVHAARAPPPITICVYYASILRCWHLVWILIMTDHPCLGVRCHSRNPEIVTIGFNADRRLRPHVGAVHRPRNEGLQSRAALLHAPHDDPVVVTLGRGDGRIRHVHQRRRPRRRLQFSKISIDLL